VGKTETPSNTDRKLARAGAALELAAKQAEINELLARFPQLRTAAYAVPVRNGRAWTAADRQRHSQRMRAAYRRRARANATAAR